MDRQEYREIVSEIKAGYARRDYERVIMFARELQPRKIKELSVLEIISSAYEKVGKPSLAKATLEVAYERANNSKSMAARLVMLSLKLKDVDGAVAYYEDFCRIAPHDNQRFLLKYYIADYGGLSKEDKIKILEDYTSKELDEKWLFELAKLYHEAGMGNKCADTCDELILWFANGDYLKRALELKFAHKSLTPEQQAMYESIMSEYFEGGNKNVSEKEVMEAAKLDNEAEKFANEVLGINEESKAETKENISDTKPIYTNKEITQALEESEAEEIPEEPEQELASTRKLSLHIPENTENNNAEHAQKGNQDRGRGMFFTMNEQPTETETMTTADIPEEYEPVEAVEETNETTETQTPVEESAPVYGAAKKYEVPAYGADADSEGKHEFAADKEYAGVVFGASTAAIQAAKAAEEARAAEEPLDYFARKALREAEEARKAEEAERAAEQAEREAEEAEKAAAEEARKAAEAEEIRKAEEAKAAEESAKKAAEQKEAESSVDLNEAAVSEKVNGEKELDYFEKKALREAEIKSVDEPGEEPDLTTFYERKKVEIKDDGLGLSLDILKEDKEEIQGQFSIDQLFKTYSSSIENDEENRAAVEKIEAERLKQIQDAVGGITPVMPVFDEDEFEENSEADSAEQEEQDAEQGFNAEVSAEDDDDIEIKEVIVDEAYAEELAKKRESEKGNNEADNAETDIEDDGIAIVTPVLEVDIAAKDAEKPVDEAEQNIAENGNDENAEVADEQPMQDEDKEADAAPEMISTASALEKIKAFERAHGMRSAAASDAKPEENQVSEKSGNDIEMSVEEEHAEVADLGDFFAGMLGKDGAEASENEETMAGNINIAGVTEEQAKAVEAAGLNDLDDIFANIFGEDKPEETEVQPKAAEAAETQTVAEQTQGQAINKENRKEMSLEDIVNADLERMEQEDEAARNKRAAEINKPMTVDETICEAVEANNKQASEEAVTEVIETTETAKSNLETPEISEKTAEDAVEASKESTEGESAASEINAENAAAETPTANETETSENIATEAADSVEKSAETATNEPEATEESAEQEASVEEAEAAEPAAHDEEPTEEAEPADTTEDASDETADDVNAKTEEFEIPQGDTQQIERPFRYTLDDELREELAEFFLVDNMEADITNIINNIIIAKRSGDETGGNLIVTGDAKSGKTFLAISIIKAVTKELGRGTGSVAKVQSESINGKNIEKVFTKIAGNDLIIENVGDLNDQAVEDIIKAIENGTSKNMVILESNMLAIETMINNHPEIESLFKNRIDVGELSISQWADVACDYAERKGYVINDMALLALHAKIDELNVPTARFGYDNIVYIMENAIKKAEKRNTGRLFAAFKKNDAGQKELTESDFM